MQSRKRPRTGCVSCRVGGAKKHPRAGLSQGGSGQHTAPGRFGPQRPTAKGGTSRKGRFDPTSKVLSPTQVGEGKVRAERLLNDWSSLVDVGEELFNQKKPRMIGRTSS